MDKRLLALTERLLGIGKKTEAARLYKDTQGQWWFLGIFSNKFMDRDKEIISEKAHEEYIQWLEQTGFQPVVTVLHQPRLPDSFWIKVFRAFDSNGEALNKIVSAVYNKTAFAKVERVLTANGFTVLSARVIEGKEDIAEKLSKFTESGMSHGFIVKEFGDSIKTTEKRTSIEQYRTFEMSVLPDRGRAANIGTLGLFSKLGKQSMAKKKALTDADRTHLISIYGEETATALERGTEELAKLLQEVGLEFKDFQTEESEVSKKASGVPEEEDEEEEVVEAEGEPEEEEEVAVAVPSNDPVEAVFAALNVEGLQKVIAEQASAFEALTKTVQDMEARLQAVEPLAAQVKQLAKTEDERIAEKMTPKRIDWRSGYSAIKADDNLASDEQKVKGPSAPTPKGYDVNNPLEAMIATAMGLGGAN